MTETTKQTLAYYIIFFAGAYFISTLGNEIDLLKLIAFILFWTGLDRVFRKEIKEAKKIDAYNKDVFD